MLLGLSELFDSFPTTLWILYRENRIGRIACKKGKSEQWVGVIKQQGHTDPNIQNDWEEVLGESFKVLLESSLGFVQIKKNMPLGAFEIKLRAKTQHMLVSLWSRFKQRYINDIQCG